MLLKHYQLPKVSNKLAESLACLLVSAVCLTVSDYCEILFVLLLKFVENVIAFFIWNSLLLAEGRLELFCYSLCMRWETDLCKNLL